MDIEILETGVSTANSGLFKDLAEYLDDQVSKGVLGQTRTVDSAGGGLNNGDAGTQVREDIERADARALELCFNRDVIRVYVLLNYGPNAKAPYLTVARPEQKNVEQMVDAAMKLVPMGFRVRQADLREAIGFAEPQDDDEVFQPPITQRLTGIDPPMDVQQALGAARVRAELLAQELEGGADAIALAAKQQATDAPQLLKPVVDQVLKLAAMSQTADEFRRRLAAYKPDADLGPLTDRLALLTFQTLAGGIVGDRLKN